MVRGEKGRWDVFVVDYSIRVITKLMNHLIERKVICSEVIFCIKTSETVES